MSGFSSLGPSQNASSGPSRSVRKYARKASKAIMKSHRFHIPKYDMPIRLRPWFMVFTVLVMLLLALLGFTNSARSIPLNDKIQHFICFLFATAVFYFIFDVEEDARRIWFWRHSGLIFTAIVCFFFGGLISEIVQSALPSKEFRMGDVVANLCGSAVGLYVSYYLEKYYRHRREIARLYRPLDTDALSESSHDDDELGTQLLPTHVGQSTAKAPGAKHAATRLGDVWDEREELFGVGSDEEDSGDEVERGRDGGGNGHVQAPRIVVTGV